ncbi:MAG: ATP phosphoribosyltransferase, partial [Caldilineae bacterium]
MFALPKGRLATTSMAFLTKAGVAAPASTNSRKLVLTTGAGTIGYVMAKPKDVPTYVEHGAADLGICGL